MCKILSLASIWYTILESLQYPIRKYGSTLRTSCDCRGFIKKGARKSYLAMHVTRCILVVKRYLLCTKVVGAQSFVVNLKGGLSCIKSNFLFLPPVIVSRV